MEKKVFVDVVFPLALPKLYTYEVPIELLDRIKIGVRVEVQLRNKNYSAIVYGYNDNTDFVYKPKPILQILDQEPIVTSHQIDFWKWLSNYYCSTIGEVMHLSLPAGLKLSSETQILLHPGDHDTFELSDSEYLIYEALTIRNKISIHEAKLILDKKTIYHEIRGLLEKQIIYIEEELKNSYKPKRIKVVKWSSNIDTDEKRMEALLSVERAKSQTRALLGLIQLSKSQTRIPVGSLYALADVNLSVLKALEKKEILSIQEIEVSRFETNNLSPSDLDQLSEEQERVVNELNDCFKEDNRPVLLHGVTGSGKTRIYSEFIQKTIKEGKQVLYLLPEIALTTQMVSRLKNNFSDDLMVYHSRMNNNERVEAYQSVLLGKKIVLGARSALFLPFVDLGLIIVDEEHDSSYKQEDPAPRYNARDAAIVLSKQFEAKIILGSATPSIDTYHNCQTGKYHLLEIKHRYGGAELPKIEILDLKRSYKTGGIKSMFSKALIQSITETLDRSEQVIIFQNRRGYAPSLLCTTCGWTPVCKNCDVQMTLHMYFDDLRCHYCGYRSKNPRKCLACGSRDFKDVGYGTEKIEEAVRNLFPNAKPIRLDYDTAKSKYAFEDIIEKYAKQNYNILIGTQMVTKGLDFENVGLVAVMNADSILNFPSYKSGEKAYQLLTQVAGRAGRKNVKGKMIVQTFTPKHPILREVIEEDYFSFFNREVNERKTFLYPPFYRQVALEVKHRDAKTSLSTADYLAGNLKKKLGKRVIGPAQNYIPRVRNQFIFNILIKIEKNSKQIEYVKELVREEIDSLKEVQGLKNTRININVDP